MRARWRDPAFAVAQHANLARGRAQRWAAPRRALPSTSGALGVPTSSSPRAVGAGVDKSTVIATAVLLALLVIVIIAIAYANRDAKESQRPAERPFYGSYYPSHRF